MRTTDIAICTGLLVASLLSPAMLRAQAASVAKPDAKPPKVTLASLAAQVAQLTQTVQSLQNQLASANAQNAFALGQFVTVDTKSTINGLKGPHVIVTGANVHVRSGSGQTQDTTGLGNLVIGYDSDSVQFLSEGPGVFSCDQQATVDANRTGSHNLIVGDCHEFTKSSGFAAGFGNTISGFAASVSGGAFNAASGINSSVTGGDFNSASGFQATVSGGECNTAGPGLIRTDCVPVFPLSTAATVSGGIENLASGSASSVSGGYFNTAATNGSSVSGGLCNTAGASLAKIDCMENDTDEASVTGGIKNLASGGVSSVNGGGSNTASGNLSSVGGGQSQTATQTGQNIN